MRSTPARRRPLHKAAAPLDAVPIDWTFPPIHRVISILVERGANIDAQDNKGRTPLHLATYGGFADAAEHLIALGADTTIRKQARQDAVGGCQIGLSPPQTRTTKDVEAG